MNWLIGIQPRSEPCTKHALRIQQKAQSVLSLALAGAEGDLCPSDIG